MKGMENENAYVWRVRLIFILAFLLFGFAVIYVSQEPENPRAERAVEAAAGKAGVVSLQSLLAVEQEAEAVPEEPQVIAGRVMTEATPTLLESVPLSKETQWKIYELCDEDNGLFCAVMAISRKETVFVPDAIGDDGRSYGMMQIYSAYHEERISKLGVTDLLDPVQNAAVGISYIEDLEEAYNVGTDSHVLYMAYNMGPTGAQRMFDKGIYSNGYTWAVVGYYEAYMQELDTGG